jgi:uncharacterized membrane protein
MQRLRLLWDRLRTGLWPIPLGMSVLAALLYIGAAQVDIDALGSARLRSLLYSGSGDDARNLLSTLVSALITMSSVVFSITLVALSLGANQFGSRLVRTYMADSRTKLALGLFSMTIVYCLLTLRSLHQDAPLSEAPHFAVTLGLLLALVCVLTLLLFLHVVARSIIADEVIRRVVRELEQSIAELPALDPRKRAMRRSDHAAVAGGEPGALVSSRHEGYVQAIEYDALVALARAHDVRIELGFRAGAFVSEQGWLAHVAPRERSSEALAAAIHDHILIGRERTPTQDVEYTLRHVVDIALRALSPAVNDSNTALVVIDHLSGALARLMRKEVPSGVWRDAAGVVRVVSKYNDYAGVLGAALHQIREASAEQPAVVIQLLRALGRIGEHVSLPEQRDALLHHARLVAAAGMRKAEEPCDCADIENAWCETRLKLERMLGGESGTRRPRRRVR